MSHLNIKEDEVMLRGPTKVGEINRNRRSLRERLRDGTAGIVNIGSAVGNAVSNVVVGCYGKTISAPIAIQSDRVHFRNVDLACSASSYSFCDVCGSVKSDKKSKSVDSSDAENYEELSPKKSEDSSKSDLSEGCKKFTVVKATNNDTLTSLAAKYETTPGELIKINRLSGRLVFPGQEIKVPCVELKDEVFEEKRVKVERKFVKLAVKHVTDGNGVVSGTLLITPNAVMFDPNVSDPLVIEQGAESYGVILPLEVIVHCGLYSDIASMKVEKGLELQNQTKPILYGKCTTKVEKPPRPSKNLKRLSFPLSFLDTSTSQEELCKSAPPTAGHDKKRDSKSFLDDVGDNSVNFMRRSFERLLEKPKSREEEDFTPLTASPSWYLLLTTGRPINACKRLPLVVSYGNKNYLRPEYWFHVVVNEQVEELYEFWNLYWPETYGGAVDGETLSRRNMELVTFATMDLSDLLQQTQTQQALKEDLKESWEMIKSPYTKLSSLLNRSQTLLTSTSSSATNFGQGILDSISDFASLDYNPEEVVSMSEELRQALFFANEDFGIELIGESEILEEEDLKELGKYLTPRATGYPLSLLFTSSRDGFSLSTLFRRNGEVLPEPDDTPLLLVIQDTQANIFGALISTSLRPSDVFYGNGQSFLFQLRPFRIYKWSGENSYFLKCGSDGIAIGAGDGKFGLWIDGDLNNGHSASCPTYNNPPLAEPADFVIKTLECWAFLSKKLVQEM